ncbi:unnamed protein product [Lactuca virosa]|uniref:Uncharacterized protein n=1 Tax=Lactuca virosa TaxID=75947 RepID=A0AAU9M6I4_9ASTR|nr:unnamed protein product [Lactuca virosa]
MMFHLHGASIKSLESGPYGNVTVHKRLSNGGFVGELSLGLQSIIQKFGGEEYSGVKKSAVDVAGLVPVLERLVQGVVLDSENSRFKLMETQRVKEELTNRVKLLEDYIENNRTGVRDKIQERGIFEPPSLPTGEKISLNLRLIKQKSRQVGS